jgi:3-hydroxymyristoyl/3-hydroxydecanoyl-(acyl carrier protein) dehydratase
MFELVQSARFRELVAEGRAHVGADWPPLADHFVGAPVLPGSMQIELCAQIAGPLAERAVKAQHGLERWAFLGMVRNAVFQRPVALPATIDLRAELTRVETANVSARVEARVGEEQVCRAEIVMMMIEAAPSWAQAVDDARARVARWERGS